MARGIIIKNVEGEIVMAFCEKCGKELGPDGKCDCQETQKQEAPQNSAVPQNSAGAAPKKKNTAVIIGAAAAAVVVLLVIIIAIANSSSYKTPVKGLVKLINKQSTDVFAYQEFIFDPIRSDYTQTAYKIMKKNEEVKEDFEDIKGDIKDFFDDIDGFKISSCDFVKAEPMKSSALRDIQRNSFDSDVYEDLLEEFEDKYLDKADFEELAEKLDISVSDAKKLVNEAKKVFKAYGKVKVSDGYEVTLRIYGKYDGDSDKTEKIEGIRIIKVNGTWYVYDASTLFSAIKFKEDLSDVNLYKLYRYVQGLSFSF